MASLVSEDIDKTCKEWAAKGVEFVEISTRQPWGLQAISLVP